MAATTPAATASTTVATLAQGRQLRGRRRPRYVVDEHNAPLFSFLPPTSLTFTEIRAASTVARRTAPRLSRWASIATRFAWVLYSDGSLFKVSTSDASCTSTTFAMGPERLLNFFGMRLRVRQLGRHHRHALHRRRPNHRRQHARVEHHARPPCPSPGSRLVNPAPQRPARAHRHRHGRPVGLLPQQERLQHREADRPAHRVDDPTASPQPRTPAAWASRFWGWRPLGVFADEQRFLDAGSTKVDGSTGALKATPPRPNRIIVGAGRLDSARQRRFNSQGRTIRGGDVPVPLPRAKPASFHPHARFSRAFRMSSFRAFAVLVSHARVAGARASAQLNATHASGRGALVDRRTSLGATARR